jgi:hypothetical protein
LVVVEAVVVLAQLHMEASVVAVVVRVLESSPLPYQL